MDYIISYTNTDGSFTVYHSNTKKITVEDNISADKYKYRYQLLKPYKATHEGLLTYAEDFETFCKEMRERQECFIDYKFYFSDRFAVEGVFKNFCKLTGYDKHEPLDALEVKWINWCQNSGLMFCQPGEYECFGYDFKMFYLRILGDKSINNNFRFPCRRGYETYIEELPEELLFGYYKCRITSENPNARKIFMFSKNNVYTNYSIQFARNFADEFGFKIELLHDKINCYVYHPKDIIQSQKIFNPMFYKMSHFKADFPNNRLVKHIASSISGHLISYNIKSINKKDMTDEMWDKTCYFADEMPDDVEYAIMDDVFTEDDNNSYYKILDLKNPMRYAVGRYKAFLMSFARNKCAYACMNDIENVVRVQTDGIIFTKPQVFADYIGQCIGVDRGKTGRIRWDHVNKYDMI